MVAEIQPIGQSNITFPNKTGFAAKNSQSDIFAELNKDKFVKNNNHDIRNGAIAGAALGIILKTIKSVKAGGFFKAMEETAKEASKNVFTKPKACMVAAVTLGIWTATGAIAGAIVKSLRSKN